MKIDEKAQAALQQPGTQAATFEMTAELKARFSVIGGQVIDILRCNTSSPMEAYMLLHFVMKGLEETYDIRGGIIMEKGDAKH